MTIDDIPAGMRLKEQAGWNQVEADWRRLLELQPDGGFVAEYEGSPVGTVTTCRFGGVAWVAMMLVDERFRGRGLGRLLMDHALADLDGRGVHSVRLDATPMGLPLYESLGFAVESSFLRYQGKVPPPPMSSEPGAVQASTDLDGVAALDRDVTGTDRGRLLRRLAAEHPGSLRVVAGERGITGFLMSRPGAKARQIGPCIADERAGLLLFSDARRRHAGESVFIDIPATNTSAVGLAASMGLSAGRLLNRMGRGPRVAEHLGRLWASAGPEKG
jgi:GNAT superfamily N-acetyltransferase